MGPVLTMQTKAAKRWIDRAIITFMAVLGVFMLLPFAWLFSMSFRLPAEAYKMPPSFLPPSLDFKNYWAVLHSSIPFLQIYWNSVEIAVLVTLGQLVTCTLAAFAFARLSFPGRDSIFFVMLVGLMFPAQVTIIPIYLGFAQIGLLNRPIGLVLMYLTSSFGVFLVRQFMRSQPKALEEAALMDGAGYFKIFYSHFVASATACPVSPGNHHLYPDLELLFPGSRPFRAATGHDAANCDGSSPWLPGLRQSLSGHGGHEHGRAAGHSDLPPCPEISHRRRHLERN